MQIRGEPIGVTTFEFALLPNDGKLVIVDAIERDQPHEYDQSLGYMAIDMEEQDWVLKKRNTMFKRKDTQGSMNSAQRRNTQFSATRMSELRENP